MKPAYTFLIPALAAVVSGQTAPDFSVQTQNTLVVDFQNTSTSVEPAGVLLARDDVLETPVALGQTGATTLSTYMLFMVDQDVEATPGQPRVELLHYFQPNLFGASDVLAFDAQAENATTAVGAPYIPPTPPEGDGPHRYNILLYRQPEGFSVPAEFEGVNPPADVQARIGFDMAAFAQAAGLGEPVGATWFQVENTGAASATTSGADAATGSATGTASGGGAQSTTLATTATTATTSQGSTGTGSSTASATGTSGNGAGVLDARAGAVQLALALALGLVGAGIFTL